MPTIDGKAEVTLKAGTQPGDLLRMRGYGVAGDLYQQPGRRGDQYVRVKVKVPRKLNTEQRQLLEQFRAASKSGSWNWRGASNSGSSGGSGGSGGSSGSSGSGASSSGSSGSGSGNSSNESAGSSGPTAGSSAATGGAAGSSGSGAAAQEEPKGESRARAGGTGSKHPEVAL